MWGIELTRNGDMPLARQIYLNLRGRMTGGLLKPGEALPSTRELARQLGVSRNTACEAYAILSDEGFIESRPGAPTRVAAGLALQQASPDFKPSALIKRNCEYAADFRTGKPDFAQFPMYLWRQLLGKAAIELPPNELDYGGEAGLPALREEIARWLLRMRGLDASPQDVFITAGTTQVLSLLPALPALAGGSLLVEDPCTDFIAGAWLQTGLKVIGLPVDDHGIRTELLGGMDLSSVRAVYVTPSHQFPLGGILPAGRRAELIKRARDNGFYIIEDDYDSEFRYAGAPVAPLRTMDTERAIYTGTFSKTMFPALRIGFVILPETLREQWLTRRTHTDNRNTPFEQAALAEMLRSRKFDRHVHRMRAAGARSCRWATRRACIWQHNSPGCASTRRSPHGRGREAYAWRPRNTTRCGKGRTRTSSYWVSGTWSRRRYEKAWHCFTGSWRKNGSAASAPVACKYVSIAKPFCLSYNVLSIYTFIAGKYNI
jgi:GntR family transcriptional regulator/MocR family aminotransferase